MRLRVTYDSPAALIADHDQQFARGGVLVRVPPPAGLALFDDVELELTAQFAPLAGAPVVLAAQVVQLVAGVGVAVTFERGNPALAAAVAAARRAPARDVEALARHEVVTADADRAPVVVAVAPPVVPAVALPVPHPVVPAVALSVPHPVAPAVASPVAPPVAPPVGPPIASPAPPPADVAAASAPGRPQTAPPGGAALAARIQQALHGNKDDRVAILRDHNKTLHPYVLRNPHLGTDEVLAIAKLTTVSPELLRSIAERREWGQRPEIALALVRNPRTPIPVALRLLDHVAPAELRHLAKDGHTRQAIAQVARRKVLGG